MQELVIVSSCDRCYQTDKVKVSAAATIKVVIGGHSAQLDLCERCNQEFLDPVRVLLRARHAAQRALDKSTRTSAPPARGPQPQIGPRTRCGQCNTSILIRHRARHARKHHDADPQDLTWYLDDVEKLWRCSCGLPFPTERSRNAHARSAGHQLPDATGAEAVSGQG